MQTRRALILCTTFLCLWSNAVHSVAQRVSAYQTHTLKCVHGNNCTLTPTTHPLFFAENVRPGESFKSSLTVRNESPKLACRLSASIEQTTLNAHFPPSAVLLAVTQGPHVTLGWFQQSVTPRVRLSDLSSRVPYGYILPKETLTFSWHAALDPQLGNQAQGESLQFDLLLHSECDTPKQLKPFPSPSPPPSPLPSPSPTQIQPSSSPDSAPNVLGVRSGEAACPETVPVPPSSVRATWITDESAQIFWEEVSTATSYSLRLVNQATGAEFIHTGITHSPYRLAGLSSTNSYLISLTTLNTCAQSEWSAATELPETPVRNQTAPRTTLPQVLGSTDAVAELEPEPAARLTPTQPMQVTPHDQVLFHWGTREFFILLLGGVFAGVWYFIGFLRKNRSQKKRV